MGYNSLVHEAWRGIVRRIGTGPWGAGVWWGDSQQYFLATWLATALLGTGSVTLDYYVYDHFCENPGNQCFLLGAAGCSSCLTQSGADTRGLQTAHCGGTSIRQIVDHFAS